jgi:hypothetical protein
MRRSRLIAWLSVGLIMAILILAGCGKKGDPIPPRMKLPIVADLAAASLPEGIVLNWSLDVGTQAIGGFKILRSAVSRGAEACPGCPLDYRPFTEVKLSDGRLHHEGASGFRYVDTDVRGGGFYSYRIAVCDRAGSCGEPSNTAGAVRPGK